MNCRIFQDREEGYVELVDIGRRAGTSSTHSRPQVERRQQVLPWE